MKAVEIDIPQEIVQRFCEEHHIQKLALFGSVLREDFTSESDVDVLIEFKPGHCVGLITFAGMENELSDILGRKVDLKTPGFLSPYFRDEVLSVAETIYVVA